MVAGYSTLKNKIEILLYNLYLTLTVDWNNTHYPFQKTSHPYYNNGRSSVYFSIALLITVFLGLATPAKSSSRSYSGVPYTQRPYIINNQTFFPIPDSNGYSEEGIASWYGSDFHGRRTSNGEIYNMHKQTAAHKILPMNTMLLVKNLENGLQTVVRVNDRGPFVYGRIIDLSYKAARDIGLLRNGTAQVRITALMNERPTLDNLKKHRIPDFYKGKFFVQIGSFVNEANALRLKEKFINTGHKAVIQKFNSDRGLFYRVQVWVGTDLRYARRARQALENKGYKKAFIVAR